MMTRRCVSILFLIFSGIFVGLAVSFSSFIGFDPRMFLALVGVLPAALAAIRYPACGLVALVAWDFLGSYLPAGSESSALLIKGFVVGLILTATYATLFLKQAVSGKIRIPAKGGSISIWMASFLAYVFVSFLYGVLRGNSLQYAVGDLFLLAKIPAIYFLAVFLTESEERGEKITRWIALLAIFFFSFDLVRYFLGEFGIGAVVSGQGIPRMLTNSAPYSIVVLPFALSYYLYGGRRSWQGFLAAGVSLLVLIASMTRTYWYAAFGGLAFVFLFLPAWEKVALLRKSLPVLLAVLLAGSFLVIKLGLGISFVNLVVGRGIEFSPGSKFVEVQDVLTNAAQNPLYILVGEGLGGEVVTWVYGAKVDEVAETHFIHNNYARIFLHTGIIGLILYLSIIAAFLRNTYVFFRNSGVDKFAKGLALGSLGAIAALLVGAIGTNTLFNHLAYVLMGVAVTIFWAESKVSPEENP
jgi:hypothetical protein